MDLVDDDLRLAAAPFVQLHDVKAARGAHRFAHFTGLHFGDQLQYEFGQLGALAPAELTAIQGRLAVGVRDRELAEILALGGACGQILGLVRDLLQLLRGGGLRQRQQNVRHVEFIVGGRGLLAREKLLELMRADVDVRNHVALTQGAQGQFLAHALAILLVVDALAPRAPSAAGRKESCCGLRSPAARCSIARRTRSSRPAWRAALEFPARSTDRAPAA